MRGIPGLLAVAVSWPRTAGGATLRAMSSLRFVSLLLPLWAACASTPIAPTPASTVSLTPVPAGELRRPATYSMLALLVPEGRQPAEVVQVIADAAKAIERPVTQDSQELLEGALLVDVIPVEQILSFDVIDFESLGIDAAEIARIKATRVAVSMVLAGPAETLVTVQRQAAEVARAAVAKGGWLFDGGTFQVFTRERFDEFRPVGFPLEVERLVSVMVDDSADDVRLETLGMERLGLPELRMLDVPKTHLDGAIALFNAAAQIVVEQAYIERAGELVIDLRTARMPHLKELYEEASKVGGGEAVTLAAFWDASVRGEDAEPVIRLDLVTNKANRSDVFGALLRRIFGAEVESSRMPWVLPLAAR